jgi:hypothetical protein
MIISHQCEWAFVSSLQFRHVGTDKPHIFALVPLNLKIKCKRFNAKGRLLTDATFDHCYVSLDCTFKASDYFVNHMDTGIMPKINFEFGFECIDIEKELEPAVSRAVCETQLIQHQKCLTHR